MSGGPGPRLFQPFRLGGMTLENRIAIAPMCQYSAVDGAPGAWHAMHLGQLAISGAGLLIIEATAVSADGRITGGDLGLYDDAQESALAVILADVRRFAPSIRIGMQIGHAGRKASCEKPWQGGRQVASTSPGGWRCSAPSAIPFSPDNEAPCAMSDADIAAVIEAFVATTRRAARLGIDLVEIHAAHGYLLHTFLSPLSNARTDAFGGALENRMRLPLSVFDAVRAAFPPDRPVGVRVSATDWVPGGWDIDETVTFAKALDARGCDYIHVSTGGLSPDQEIPVGPRYQVPFAARIKAEVTMPTMTVGLITDPAEAEAILAAGDADLVSLARGVLYDPRWPWHAAAALGAQVRAPDQYLRSQPHGLADLFVR